MSAADPSSSNWLRLVNCARTEEEQNLVTFQHKGQVYYRCVGFVRYCCNSPEAKRACPSEALLIVLS